MAEHDLQSIAFPTLDEAQIATERLPSRHDQVVRDGQTLFAVGDRDIEFFVVKSGEVEIVDCSGDEPKHSRPPQGQFTGDVSHLTGTRGGQRRRPRPLRVYEISGEALRRS